MMNKSTNTNSISSVEGFEGTLFVKECHDVKILYVHIGKFNSVPLIAVKSHLIL